MYSTKNRRERIPSEPTFSEEQTTQHLRLCVIKTKIRKYSLKSERIYFCDLSIGIYQILHFDEGTKTDDNTFPSTSFFYTF